MKKTLALLLTLIMVLCSGMTVCAAPKVMADGGVFDPQFYAAFYPDVYAAFGNNENLLYQHYLRYGKAEGRLPYDPASMPVSGVKTMSDGGLFDPQFYYNTYPDVAAAFGHNEALLYQHGTHFVFPDSMLRSMLPLGSGLLVRLMFRAGREHPKECKATRVDIDRRLQAALLAW